MRRKPKLIVGKGMCARLIKGEKRELLKACVYCLRESVESAPTVAKTSFCYS